MYGTSKEAVNRVRKANKICILDIDVQGVKSCIDANFPVGLLCFIAPPSIDELEKRLRARGTETEESLSTRIRNASREMEAVRSPHRACVARDGLDVLLLFALQAASIPFDIRIVNDDVEDAYRQLQLAVEPLLRSRRSRV